MTVQGMQMQTSDYLAGFCLKFFFQGRHKQSILKYMWVEWGEGGGGMVVHRSGDIFPRKISNLIKKNKQYIGRLVCFPMKHLINKVASEGPSGLCSRRPQLIKLVMVSRSWV